VQVQLVREDDSPWSDWISEYAVIKPASQGVPRLSGYGIRKKLYIGRDDEVIPCTGNTASSLGRIYLPGAATPKV
jgi:hypothetical protein